MRTKIKNKHSDEFFENKYKEFKNWAKSKHVENPFNSQSAFEGAWDKYRKMGSKNPWKDIKYAAQYHTDFRTASSELKFLKAANVDTDLKLKDLKKMTTQEFYDKFQDEIKEFRKEMKTMGLNSYDTNKMIAIHFFGSR